jgi:hypothetical protein
MATRKLLSMIVSIRCLVIRSQGTTTPKTQGLLNGRVERRYTCIATRIATARRR